MVFALLCIIDSMAMGCVIQVNAVTSAFYGVMGLDTALCGGVFTFLAVAVIVTGARGISELTERLVPLMTIIYIVLSLAVMLARPGEVFRALGKIFAGALAPASAGGGAVGYVISRGVRFGVMRGLMSNEAGCGTAPIAHAGSSARYPSEQGFWGIFEVFVDTILLCSMTAIVVIIGTQGRGVRRGLDDDDPDGLFVGARRLVGILHVRDGAFFRVCHRHLLGALRDGVRKILIREESVDISFYRRLRSGYALGCGQ